MDGESRVGKTGIVFLDTLFDENAACHIAYGQGITRAVDGSDGVPTRSSSPAVSTTRRCTPTS